MEDFFPLLIVIIGAISSIVSAVKKNQQSADAQRRHAASFRQLEQQPMAAPAPAPAEAAAQVIAPTVHPHLAPDCATHDQPGSLGVASLEGKDPCHQQQLTHPRTEEAPAQEEAGLTFDWSGENLVKAFVMQEVLTRPCHRQAR